MKRSKLDNVSIKNKNKQSPEIKKRLFFMIIALVIFRIGSFIPVPGIDTAMLATLLEQQRGTILEIFNMFSGGALNRASVFALGIMPYVSASIIVQLLTMIHPKLIEIKKDGEAGQYKINKYTKYCTLILGMFQSIGIATSLPNISGMKNIIINSGFSFYFTAVISLVCGTMFLMWLGEQITERGIGNGISIIIFTGIVSGLSPAVGYTIEQTRQGDIHLLFLILVSILIFSVIFFVVFIERGQRRILVNYAKRQQGRRIYSQQSTHLPLKINMAGVIPTIFASSIILLPTTIISWFGGKSHWNWLNTISLYLQPGQIIYIFIYAVSIIFFCFFYTILVFNPRETAENLKKSGAFIFGIRPGEQTARYINKIIMRLTFVGSIYITFICLIPEFMRQAMKMPFYFGGTSLLIVVVVIIDFISQIQTLIMSNQYDSILKKARLKY